jgi:GNAT superfamily N-acetyltransferase
MLVAHDMDTRMDLSPWLAGVFVAPHHRRRGVGAALVQRIIDEATGLGVEQLYLCMANDGLRATANQGKMRDKITARPSPENQTSP